ncbi:hypothetical protein HK103_002775 [Boothiomyces macroporosus]|uniref:Amino acid transporter transmembrane domain-containing protein n=1 Tax=Boothiomyces macroporosus TaxID=261099 RepID=A0AAD5Y741_9FUNG|nr:hypothetical protein HK103_002748 [Boothiomyces macroporosus]KAJ3262360.1 hypothetical protein HK103_002775 [Boothiomyces macroporosus]
MTDPERAIDIQPGNRRGSDRNYGSFLDLQRNTSISNGNVQPSWSSSYKRSLDYTYFRNSRASGVTLPSISIEDPSPNTPDFTDDESPLLESSFLRNPKLARHDDVLGDTEVIYEEEESLIEEIDQVHSTFSQTLFNSVNILMGIGILSLPFGFAITGWAVGLGLLVLFGLMTYHTGLLLGRCLGERKSGQPVCYTYGDIGIHKLTVGEAAFGMGGRTFICIVFFLELCAANIALIILAADSIVALVPSLDLVLVKCAVAFIVFPLTWPRSLAIVSYGSLIGIIAILNLVAILLVDGFSKSTAPGSLWEPGNTSVLPPAYYPIPLAFGLIMAGFSGMFKLTLGHSVFPNLYRDMREPEKFPLLLKSTYLVIMIFYALVASAGYYMFGDAVREEVSVSNLDYSKSSVNSRI